MCARGGEGGLGGGPAHPGQRPQPREPAAAAAHSEAADGLQEHSAGARLVLVMSYSFHALQETSPSVSFAEETGDGAGIRGWGLFV